MSLTIAQESHEFKPGLWKWAVWIDGNASDLNRISTVEYRLHPTFRTPVRVTKDRQSAFRLDETCWGEFMIYAKLTSNEGHTEELRHWLRLGREGAPEPQSLPDSDRVFFLTTGIEDEPFADALQEALELRHCKILRPSDEPGLPFEVNLDRALKQANAAVVILSDRRSRWLTRELAAIAGRGLATFSVLIGQTRHDLPPDMKIAKQIHIKGGDDIEMEATNVANAIVSP